MIDLHMHTARCGHASGTVREYVEAGRAAGLDVMCFTDHLPMPAPYPQHYTMRADELDAYLADVRSVAEETARDGGPEILVGVEADWLPGHMDAVRTMLAGRELDMVLGSVHFIGDWAFDDPDLTGRYGEWDIDALWMRYFGDLTEAASSGLFDVMAHPDLVKKFGHRPSFDPGYLYEEAAKAAAEAGVLVELSTAGLRKPVGEMYPSVDMLAALFSAGVDMTVGSDAHAADEVGYGIEDAYRVLADSGFTRVALPLGGGERAWYEL